VRTVEGVLVSMLAFLFARRQLSRKTKPRVSTFA
jgi:hypothetical protein